VYEDQSIARGKPPLVWEEYLELMLSACSDYDKSHTIAHQAQRNIYATNVENEVDYNYPHEDATHGVIMEIYADVTHTTNLGSTSPFIPLEQWIQLAQEKRDVIFDKRLKTTGSPPGGRVPSNQPMRRVNAHLMEGHVKLDDIIEYTINTPLVHEESKTCASVWAISLTYHLMELRLVTFDIFLLLNKVMFKRKEDWLILTRHPTIWTFLRLVIVPTSLIKTKP
jgi:hypothetical protein